MALSSQNKNFLSFMQKLGIDLNQFPDKTFDGLFDNVPEPMNYFFNWIVENVTSDNVLTKLEEAEYFELEKNNCLPGNEEMDYYLSTCRPSFVELQALDTNYISTVLSGDLSDLKESHEKLTKIYESIVVKHNEVKKNQNVATEKISVSKKQLDAFNVHCSKANSHLNKKLEDAKLLLLRVPDVSIDVDVCKNLLNEEEHISQKYNINNLLSTQARVSNNSDALSKLEENLINVEMVLLMSRGHFISKQVKIDVLTEFLKSSIANKNDEGLCSFDLMSLDNTDSEGITMRCKEINFLENELCKEIKEFSHLDIMRIEDNYYTAKADVKASFINILKTYRNNVKYSFHKNSWLLHILLLCVESLVKIKTFKKECLSKINSYETIIQNNISSLELQKQKFKEVASRHGQHPFTIALKEALNQEEDDVEHETNLRNITKLMTELDSGSSSVLYKLQNDMEFQIKSLINGILCGPTRQVLPVPIDLLLNSQACEKNDRELSHEIKRLLNKYLETKELVAKSDRKSLLLWMDFLSNPSALQAKLEKLNLSVVHHQ